MKKLAFLTTFLCVAFYSAISQDRAYQFAQFVDYDVIKANSDTARNYLSPPSLNIFFNNQMSRYLSGSEDLVMNKTYAILNSADKELSIGGTFTSKKKKRDFVRSMMQIGVKLKADDDFAELFNDEDGLAASAGIFLKGTLFSRGVVTFGDNKFMSEPKGLEPLIITDKQRASENRILKIQQHEKYLDLVYQEKYDGKVKEIEKLMSLYAKEYKLDAVQEREKVEEKTAVALEELKAEYMDEVQKYMSTSQSFIATHRFWASIDVFIPITSTEYVTAASNTTTDFDTIQLRPFSAELIGSYLSTRSSGKRYFASVSAGFEVHNTITRDELSKTSFRTLIERDASTPDIELTEVKNNEVYVGEIDDLIIVPSVELNGSMMFGGNWSFTGLSASVEHRLDPDNPAWYLKGGVPFSLAGKDDETKVNFEPLVKWDTNNEKINIGISVGIPLGKSIY